MKPVKPKAYCLPSPKKKIFRWQLFFDRSTMNNTDALEIENDLDISASGLENTVDSHGIAHAIIFSSLAIVSMISSSIVVWLILHSKSKLTSIYHRILLGMSFGDFLYSLGGAHFNAMAPSDVNYIVWNARGNLGKP